MMHDEINLALKNHLEIMADIPATIVWPNDPARGKGKLPRWEVSFSHNPPTRLTFSARHEYSGQVRIIVVVKFASLEDQVHAYSASLTDHFSVDVTLGKIRISRPPHCPGGFKDGIEYRYPVLISWQAFA